MFATKFVMPSTINVTLSLMGVVVLGANHFALTSVGLKLAVYIDLVERDHDIPGFMMVFFLRGL